jgi:surface protein
MNTFIKNNSLLSAKTKLEYIYNPNNLVIVYDTTLGNGSNTIYVPVQGTSPNVTIDWGDGLSNIYTTTGYKSHTYATSGTYVVQISGTMRTLSHSATIPVAGSKEKLIRCLSFGNIGLTSLSGGFIGCSNLLTAPSSCPSTITVLTSVFENCTNFNSSINDWNVSNVTTMSRAFYNAIKFNQPLNNWNVGKVTNFSSMFANASSFNGDLSGWNIGANVATPSINMGYIFDNSAFNNSSIANWNTNKVINLIGAFSNSVFNQNINNWDVSKVTNMTAVFSSNSIFNQPLNNWNTGSVTSMNNMFNGCSLFNQNISSWNTSNATNMSGMFYNCINFNQPLNSWNVSKVTTFQLMFYNADSFNQNLSSWNISGITTNNGLYYFMLNATGLSTSNYDALLIAWNSNKASYRNDLKPNFGGSKYSAAGASARAALIGYGWTITDGGLAP